MSSPRIEEPFVVDPGTLGGNPCQMNLIKILNELGNKANTRKVLSLLEDFRLVCLHLDMHAKLVSPWTAERLLLLAYEDAIKKIDRAALATVVETHWKCCLRVPFKKVMNEIKIQKTRGH